MPAVRTISRSTARRLAIAKQGLAGPRPPAGAEGILEAVRRLGCLQLDPVSVVARSHELVLLSRLGPHPLTDLDRLRWGERRLFEYWAHAASIVLTEDYPIHRLLMRTYPRGESAHRVRTREFLQANRRLHRHVLSTLRRRGPVRLREFEDRVSSGWRSGGWTNERNVERMLDILQVRGIAVVAGRQGIEKLWDLAERWFPEWTPRDVLSTREIVRLAAQRSLRALGVGTRRHIEWHFTVKRYPGLETVMAELVRTGRIIRVRIEDDGAEWRGSWFVHADDVPLLDSLEAGRWEPRTSLLSPFDNLIVDRARLELLFGFRYRLEIYVPKDRRVHGPYVMPILHGDRFIGRLDAATDRHRRRLVVNGLYAEPDAPSDRRAAMGVADAVADLATFVGARSIDVTGPAPQTWRRAIG